VLCFPCPSRRLSGPMSRSAATASRRHACCGDPSESAGPCYWHWSPRSTRHLSLHDLAGERAPRFPSQESSTRHARPPCATHPDYRFTGKCALRCWSYLEIVPPKRRRPLVFGPGIAERPRSDFEALFSANMLTASWTTTRWRAPRCAGRARPSRANRDSRLRRYCPESQDVPRTDADVFPMMLRGERLWK